MPSRGRRNRRTRLRRRQSIDEFIQSDISISVWIEALEDEGDQAAQIVENSHDTQQLRDWLVSAMGALNERERFIVRERKLREVRGQRLKSG